MCPYVSVCMSSRYSSCVLKAELADGEAEDDTDQVPSKARSERSKRALQRKLWQQVRARLPECLKQLNFPLNGPRGTEVYGFAKEVCRMYMAMHGDPEDELHVGRKDTLEQAISAVYSEKDAASLAYDGDLEEAMKEVCGGHVLVLTCMRPYSEVNLSLC